MTINLSIPSIPNSDTVAWIVAPAIRCAAFVAEQHKINGTVERGLVALASQRELILAARQFAAERVGNAATVPLDELLRHQQLLGPWAQEIIDHDFHEVHVSMLVALWSAVEVAVEDTIVLILFNDPDAVIKLAAAGLDVRKILTD